MQIFRTIKKFWNPIPFHGIKAHTAFFEGWYFKIVDVTEQYGLAIIPGIATDGKGKTQVFIQILDGKQIKSAFFAFDPHSFAASEEVFNLTIENNRFSMESLYIDMPTYKGNINFINHKTLKQTLLAPNIMGWYSFIPWMQCNHALLTMICDLQGEFEIDWGSSFPKSWIWLQCCHFDTDPDASLFCSIAHIPWMGSYFIGFICTLYVNNQFYHFATYNNAKRRTAMKDKKLDIHLSRKQVTLDIHTEDAKGGELISPVEGLMLGKLSESMNAPLYICLREKGKIIFEGRGRNASLEVVLGNGQLIMDN
jgi:tocopherol cyclase